MAKKRAAPAKATPRGDAAVVGYRKSITDILTIADKTGGMERLAEQCRHALADRDDANLKGSLTVIQDHYDHLRAPGSVNRTRGQ